MQKIISLLSQPTVKKLDRELEKVFNNAPHLPKKVVDILVKITPYLILISGLFLISGGLRSIFGSGELYRTFNFWKSVPVIYFYVIGLLQVLAGIISIAAYKPLKNRKLDGWMALFILTILELLMNIVSVIFLGDGIFGLLLGLLLSLYLLYELKANYTEQKSKAVSNNKTKTKSTKKKSK